MTIKTRNDTTGLDQLESTTQPARDAVHFRRILAARKAIVTVAHPQLGDFPMQNVVPKLSDTPGEVRWVGPELGEHTDEVLAEALDLDEAARSALRDAGVI